MRIPRIVPVHGETLIDDYAWLRDRTNPEVMAYLEAENAHTDAWMERTEALQETLYREMLGRIRETDVNVPWPMGEWEYYSRTEEGKQYAIVCRRRRIAGAHEETVLDLNALAAGREYLSLGDFEVSDDGNFLAYSIDDTGFRQYTLFIKDLRTGAVLPDVRRNVSSVAWSADGMTLFFVVEDHAKRPWRLYRHRLGSEGDELLFEEDDQLFRIWISRSRSGRFVFLTTASGDTSEVRFFPATEAKPSLRLIEPRRMGLEYYADHRGEDFWIVTNDRGKNFRLVNAPLDDPSAARWHEVLPHRDDVKIEDIEIFQNHLVVLEREHGLDEFLVIDLRTGDQHRIAFNEPVYSAAAGSNRLFETKLFRLTYESFVTPLTVYDYDLDGRRLVLRKQTEVLGGYDPAEYVSERIFAPGADGTAIPISLVRRRTTSADARQPLLLYGYGAYGYAVPVTFSSNRLSLLDRGAIFAIAHVRGGGEMGKEWHDRGKMEWKENTFADFIACAEQLIATGYTDPSGLVALGASAGGLLIGTVINRRPELFRAAVALVPFVDVINTMLDPSLPLTVGEYLEWGNPNVESEYRRMKAYDPYICAKPQEYPALLVRTSLHDSQVMYWEAAKWVARLRALKRDDNPLLLHVNMEAGHSGSSGRYDKLHEEAFDLAFILTMMGASL